MARPPPRSILIAIAMLGVAACSNEPWKASDAPKVPPDEQFRTGHEVGYDAWIWHCYEGKRVVITQAGSALLGTSRAKTSRGPCGTPLPTEADFPPPERRGEIPDGVRWPGSKPAPPEH